MVFMMIKKLIELKNKLKAKKPTFLRHDLHKKKRLSVVWRRPKGHHNKMRLHRKGYAKGRSTGYGSPALVRGLTREGLMPQIIFTKKDFTDLNKEVDGIIISRTVGLRKTKELVAYAEENGFKVLNTNSKKVEDKLNSLIAVKKESRKKFEEKKKLKETKAKTTEKKKEEKVEDKKEIKKDTATEKIMTPKEELTKGDSQ